MNKISEKTKSAGTTEADNHVAKLRELEQTEHEIGEKLLYLWAELDNFRKMADGENAELRRTVNEALLQHLIPVAGLLDSAIRLARKENNDGMAVGLEMILKQFLALFQKYGVSITENSDSPDRRYAQKGIT